MSTNRTKHNFNQVSEGRIRSEKNCPAKGDTSTIDDRNSDENDRSAPRAGLKNNLTNQVQTKEIKQPPLKDLRAEMNQSKE